MEYEEIENAYKLIDDFYSRTIELKENKNSSNKELLLKIPLLMNKKISDCLQMIIIIQVTFGLYRFNLNIFENWNKLKWIK